MVLNASVSYVYTRIFKRAIVFCFFLLIANTAKSKAEVIDTLNTKQLHEIEVKALYKKDLIAPVPVQSIQITDLPLKSLSVADAIRFFSGVQIKDYGGVGGLKTVNVRSMGTNHTAIFYDGIQLNNAQNGQVDLGKYSLENVETIELYSGQKDEILLPARAYAASSAIYLKAAKPFFLANKKQSVKLGFKTGSFDLINPNIYYQQKINKKLSFTLNADYLESSGKYKFRYADYSYDTTVVRQNGDIKALRTEFTVFGKQKNDNWQIKLYSYNSERGLPGAIVANKYNFFERQKDDNFFVQANYESNLNKKYQYLLQAKYSQDFLKYTDPDFTPNYTLINKYTQQEFYFTFANSYKFSQNFGASLSADFLQQDLNANLKNFAYPKRYSGFIAFSSYYKINDIKLSANVLNTLVKEEVKVGVSAKDRSVFTPTFLASWQPSKITNLSLRAFYKSIFRMPTFNDLYYTAIGSSSLNPEYTKQFNVGFSKWYLFNKGILNRLEIKADAYHNKVTDKIVAIPTLNLFRWTMVNLDEVSINGTEWSINALFDISNHLKLNTTLNYTYEKALDVTKSGFTYKQQIPYIPNHSGSFRAGLVYKEYNLNYSYLYTGQRYNQRENIKANYMQPWYTHDLAIARNFKFQNQQLVNIGLEVNNLFNQYYDVVLNYPMPGRNYRLHLNFKF